MTISYINIGSSANKGDGDTLRTAFRKINENFSFLSTASGFLSTGSSTSLSISPDAPSTATDGTLWFNSSIARTFVRYNGAWVDASPQVTPPPTTSTETIITMGSVPPDTGEGTLWFNVNDARTYINYGGAWIDSSPQVTPPSILPADNIGVLANDGNGNLYWTTASITASTGTNVDFLAVDSSILPASNLTYDLGSLSKQWRSLYVGTSTIYIGGVAVSINTVSNTLVVGTSTRAVTLATENYVTSQIAAIPPTESYIGTGNFTVTASDTVNYVIAGTGVSTSTVIFNFRIHGSVGGVAPGVSDPEYVTITTGAQPVSEIYLTKYVSTDNRAFFAIQQGNQWTIPQNQVTPGMLAYSHFGINGVQVGQNILNGFGPLQPNTTYTFWIQQIGAAATEYVFSTNRFDTGGNSPLFYSQNPLAPTTITPTTSVVGGELDPALSLIKGYKYTFNVNTPGQPLWIMTTSTYNITNRYAHGITNNGTSTGIITFTVPGDAPDKLYYISENSSLSMKGIINISGVTSNSSNGIIVQSATAPATTSTSTIWYDTVGGRSYVYYDSGWVDANPMPTVDTTQLTNNGYSLGLDSAGVVNLPTFAGSPSVAIIQTASAGISLNANGAFFNFNQNNSLTFSNNGRIVLHPYGNAYIESVNYGVDTSTSALNIFAGPNQNINLRAGFGTEAHWTFGTDGSFTAPGPIYGGVNTIGLATPAPLNLNNTGPVGQVKTQLNLINTAGNAGTGSAIDYFTYVDQGNGLPGARLQAVDDNAYSANFSIALKGKGNTGNNGLTTVWTFGSDGTLKVPGTIYAQASDNGSIVFSNDGSTDHGSLKVDGGYNMVINSESNYYVKRNGQDRFAITDTDTTLMAGRHLVLKSNKNSTEQVWSFNSTGSLTFPDNTVQTTAYKSTSGSWTLATGSNTVSITVPLNGNYQMWVNGNIPNGIVEWNATVNVSNPNVPAIGSQYAWYYAAGNALVLTSIPNQIVGTAGVISSSTAYVGTTSNVFSFGITNNSTSTRTVNWGYTTL
jgi:hypothetical protein